MCWAKSTWLAEIFLLCSQTCHDLGSVPCVLRHILQKLHAIDTYLRDMQSHGTVLCVHWFVQMRIHSVSICWANIIYCGPGRSALSVPPNFQHTEIAGSTCYKNTLDGIKPDWQYLIL
ncbi:uncharacterized protein LOC110981658 isoform X3 [Acanthaster planci]|uniref:Uncharacterized protein LOC110981658 isoform X3 n=1 Tax=Acanthaster planci TaxID=133434 RepID=A0A8B7YRK7_ACAPL|nr:uncharacterized protein LOC110981658 isoform X3 [Acanthaster planci]